MSCWRCRRWAYIPTGDDWTIEWITEGAHSGQRALKISSLSVDRPNPSIDSTPPFELEKGKKYQLSAYVRTDQAGPFSLGMSWFEDDGVTRAGGQRSEDADFASTEWTQVFVSVDSSNFSFYPNASIGNISILAHMAGTLSTSVRQVTLYIDDVSFREIIE